MYISKYLDIFDCSSRILSFVTRNSTAMLNSNRISWLLAFIFLAQFSVWGQGSPDYTGGMKVKLNEDGSKYFRLITWHQMWATLSEDGGGNMNDLNFRLRRSRMLMYAQINKRFLILTHFGLNNLRNTNMDPVGTGAGAQLFMHDAWAEYSLVPKKLSIGGGLHYWNGISRLTNQSTLNIMTLDAPGHNWGTIGTSDQFARHLGFYIKGKLGKLDYRLAINEALANNFHAGVTEEQLRSLPAETAVYKNFEELGGGKIYAGYLKYEFLDAEGNLLPFLVGSYLGSKKVFNIGAGFFYHEEGTSHINNAGNIEKNSPFSFAVDAFYDTPIGENGQAFTGYASYTSHDWGPNLSGAPTRGSLVGGVGSGDITYVQLGYVLPNFSDKGRLQPYLHFTNRSLDVHEEFEASNSTQFGIGANWYLSGHNAKITLEYQNNRAQGETVTPDGSNLLRLQMMIYL